jgi:hypothetical protein
VPAPRKFGVSNEHARLRWPRMCEYSSRDVYSQRPISNTEAVDRDSRIARRSKPNTDIDRCSYRSCYVWLLNGYCWRAGSSWGLSSLWVRNGMLAPRLLSRHQRPGIRPPNPKSRPRNQSQNHTSFVHIKRPSIPRPWLSARKRSTAGYRIGYLIDERPVLEFIANSRSG